SDHLIDKDVNLTGVACESDNSVNSYQKKIERSRMKAPHMFCARRSITPTNQIASILQMEEANVRQLVSRARKHTPDASARPSVRASSGAFQASIAAAQKGDMTALEGLFA